MWGITLILTHDGVTIPEYRGDTVQRYLIKHRRGGGSTKIPYKAQGGVKLMTLFTVHAHFKYIISVPISTWPYGS